MSVFNFRDWVSSWSSFEENSVRCEGIIETGGPEAKVQLRKGSPGGFIGRQRLHFSPCRVSTSVLKTGVQHPGRKALGTVQHVEAGIVETEAEMALRALASREWFVFSMC